MCRWTMYDITVPAEQFDSAHEIIDKFYERGDIERISVNHDAMKQTYHIWMECSTEDFESIKKQLQDKQIKLL